MKELEEAVRFAGNLLQSDNKNSEASWQNVLPGAMVPRPIHGAFQDVCGLSWLRSCVTTSWRNGGMTRSRTVLSTFPRPLPPANILDAIWVVRFHDLAMEKAVM